jgi:hypothetical protein
MQGSRETWAGFSGGCRRKNLSMRIDRMVNPVRNRTRLCRSPNVISALVKRQSLQTADRLVADPTVDADASNRS